MTAPIVPIRSSLPDAYLALVADHPELYEAPHHPDHEDCWLCASARRAFGCARCPRQEAADD